MYGSVSTKGCQLAFDGSASTSWRPGKTANNAGGTNYLAGDAWISFMVAEGSAVGCIKVTGSISSTHKENEDSRDMRVERSASTHGDWVSAVAGYHHEYNWITEKEVYCF